MALADARVTSAAIVTEFVGGACWWRTECIVYAGDCAQILVDGFDLMVGHVVKQRPWHDLKLVTVDGSGNANSQRDIRVRS